MKASYFILLIFFLSLATIGNSQTAKEYFDRGYAKISQFDSLDYIGAIADFTKSIEIDSENADAYIKRGFAREKLKDYLGAIADFNKALEINPKHSGAYYIRGKTKSDLQDYRGAIADYTKAIEFEPNNKMLYYNRALLEINIGQKESGCLDLSKAGELGSEEAYKAIKEYCQ